MTAQSTGAALWFIAGMQPDGQAFQCSHPVTEGAGSREIWGETIEIWVEEKFLCLIQDSPFSQRQSKYPGFSFPKPGWKSVSDGKDGWPCVGREVAQGVLWGFPWGGLACFNSCHLILSALQVLHEELEWILMVFHYICSTCANLWNSRCFFQGHWRCVLVTMDHWELKLNKLYRWCWGNTDCDTLSS